MENCACYGKLSHRKEIDFQIENVKKRESRLYLIKLNVNIRNVNVNTRWKKKRKRETRKISMKDLNETD